MKFAELVKNLRVEQRISLRQFCAEMGVDPSNWSKIERGINPPPKDIEVLKKVATRLNLSGDAFVQFTDAAAAGRAELPTDIASNEAVVARLPAFFRAMRGKEPNNEELAEMIKEIEKLNQPDPEEN